MGNYFAYARVSTPRQGEKGVSLQEQREAIERYASVRRLTITRWFEDRESASHTGRSAFTEMLRLLRLGKVQGVIIHKIDRSARNLEDWADMGKIADSGVEVHFATENVDLKTVPGRLSADIQAVVAAHYSRNLREEVKKGIYGRLKQGFYPFRAPIGYLNQGAAKAKVPDPVRAPIIRQIFELYASGCCSLPQLTERMFDVGLRNLNGGHVSMAGMARILRNPFYAGLMRIERNGQTYTGVHEPIVSTELFKKAQMALDGKRVDRALGHAFTYSRLVRCASCGYSLIGEEKKGHVYYRCHNRPFKKPAVCPVTSVREDWIEEAIVSKLAEVDLSDAEADIARKTLDARRDQMREDRDASVKALRLQQDSLHTRLARATDLLMDGTIDKTVFASKQQEILLEQTKVKEQLADLERGEPELLKRMETTVELAKSPSIQYKRASPEKKRELVKTLLSNLTADQKNVAVTLAPPLDLIAEREKSQDGGPCRGTCRTWEELLKELFRRLAEVPIT
ncbi:MAG TPA: recombinase family protein [Candidatus Acidoferrales bacterium]|nr:recombinase family protein [Candidatus Acidoferrales bacterium]